MLWYNSLNKNHQPNKTKSHGGTLSLDKSKIQLMWKEIDRNNSSDPDCWKVPYSSRDARQGRHPEGVRCHSVSHTHTHLCILCEYYTHEITEHIAPEHDVQDHSVYIMTHQMYLLWDFMPPCTYTKMKTFISHTVCVHCADLDHSITHSPIRYALTLENDNVCFLILAFTSFVPRFS